MPIRPSIYQPQLVGVLALLLVAAGVFYVRSEASYEGAREATRVPVTLQEGLDRSRVAERIGTHLGWSEQEIEAFRDRYARMAFRAHNAILGDALAERFTWSEAAREAFFTHGDLYRARQYDVLKRVYVPGAYTFSKHASFANIAGELVTRVSQMASTSDFVIGRLDAEAAEAVNAALARALERLPDIVPLPPQDVTLVTRGGRTLLLFSTTYYNRGEGPLELVADPATRWVPGDLERNVLQYVYRADGSVRRKPVGRFAWHEEHLHYHFTDFVEYELVVLDTATTTARIDRQTKATFCIRDVSRVDTAVPNAAAQAAYRICGKERQGVSVGWGDTYFHTYPDQHVDVTGLPAGEYQLSFHANPAERFDEITTENNFSATRIHLDPALGQVTVLGTEPFEYPSVEHVYEEQPL